jgi:pyruvate dehydrogenase (quinone)/pyruvate oxidase
MAKTAADTMIETLIRWGVDTVFGMPGDGINGIMEALRQRQDEIRFIAVRHEESAAFMACGHAKFTGKLGVCLATSGPGGIHLLNGLYDANADGAPVLAITGAQFHDLMQNYGQQDVPLDRLFENVTTYNVRIMGPAHVQTATDLACRHALADRGVSHIHFPVDLQSNPMGSDTVSMRQVPGHTSHTFSRARGLPAEEDLDRAAEILNAGERVAIFAGQGANGATDELERAAEALGAPIIKALLGKACVPDDSPFTTGGLGLLGTRPSHEAMQECDTLLMIGTSFPYHEFMPKPGQARAVQIDINPARIGLRYPIEVALVGDSGETLRALIPRLEKRDKAPFLEKAQRGMKDWKELMEERGTRQDKPIKPQVVSWEVGKRLKSDAVVACDSGTVTTWWARQVPAQRGQLHTVSGTMASMACALNYAIAAQLVWPERQVVALMGDGGFTMLMAEFATAVRYNLPIKGIVFKNNTLGQIKWEQLVFLGNPEYGCDLHPIDSAAVARACGGEGRYVDDPAEVPDALDWLMACEGPALLEAEVDPHEAPMPANITRDQAIKFAKSIARGTDDGFQIMKTALGTKVREMV